MPQYRSRLPQTSGDIFITDGGLETTLIFQSGIVLPEFAAFVLLQDEAGRQTLRRYFHDFGRLAQRYRVGLILDSPTWRANRDWGARLGFSTQALADINRRAIDLLVELRESLQTPVTRCVINGVIGPRADGYVPAALMTASEAADYHGAQIDTFAGTEADMVTAVTMNYGDEAIGVALAARSARMPVAISFTVETDGRLPTGESLQQAIEGTDEASDGFPEYYMINCAHPLHFGPALAPAGAWLSRIRGVRANASQKSHAELNEATELDDGDPQELGGQYRDLKGRLSQLTVLGGCCGTDQRHIDAICRLFLS
ncbi:MAG: homocysteine S-methyltransferase family protein [Burkholderiaceae bacterium]